MIVGILLVIGFVAIMVWAVKHDKEKAKQFEEEFEKQFAEKRVYGNEKIFITPDNELVVCYAANGVKGYKIFKLENVKYIMSCWDYTAKCWRIGLYEENKKLLKGEDHNSGTKPLRKAEAHFANRSEDVEFLEMIMKFVPNAELVGLYFKEYKGSLKK